MCKDLLESSFNFRNMSNALKNFFEGVLMIIFQNIHPIKVLKQAKSFKEYFKNVFKMIL